MKEKKIPFWTDINNVPSRYPWLNEHESCEVCVIGGGTVGAAIANRLSARGVDTVLVTAQPVGFGDTSKSSPCVKYDILDTLKSLSGKIGIDNAVYVFRKAKELIDSLYEFNKTCEHSFGFSYRDSVIFTDSRFDADSLNQEYLMRKHNGFDVEYITRETSRNVFSFDVEGAIISKNLAAEVDPYILVHSLTTEAVKNGARVYENTKVVSIKNEVNHFVLTTSTRRKIKAKTIVLAIGYECDDYIESLNGVKTSGAVVSKPIDYFTGWPGKCVISFFDSTGITVSSTPDDRMFVYGDVPGMVDFNGRIAGIFPAPSFVNKKHQILKNTARQMFPGISTLDFEYEFSIQSACTPNGLPVVDRHPHYSNCFFAVCPGDSGTLFSGYCAEAIENLYFGKKDAQQRIFSLSR